MLLACCIAALTISPAYYPKSVAWAERLLVQAKFPASSTPMLSTKEALDAFQCIEAKYGRHPRLTVDKAKSYFQLGLYTRALKTLEGVSGPEAGKLRKIVHDILAFVHGINLDGRRVIQVQRTGRNWVVLSGYRPTEFNRDSSPAEVPYEDVVLQVFSETRSKVKRIWSKRLEEGDDVEPATDISVSLVDLDGDKQPEVEVLFVDFGGRMRLDSFKLGRGTFDLLNVTDSLHGLALKDLRHDGKLELLVSFPIGDHLSGPFWTSIYSLRGSHFVNVDSQFPHEFDETYREICRELVTSPDDIQLLSSAAECKALRGQWQDALALTRRARRACEVEFQYDLKHGGDAARAMSMYKAKLSDIAESERSYRRKQL